MFGAHGSYRMVATFTEVVPPDRLAPLNITVALGGPRSHRSRQ
jgi:hypothetical protein